MEDVANRFAKEMADAIAAAVSDHPQVEECRQRAREAGYELQVSLEAVIGFRTRTEKVPSTALVPVTAAKTAKVTANDRRFLKSLRIAMEDPPTADS